VASITIIGDGPGGLSAALFLAKGGHQVTVFGTDETALHSAFLRNYLGAPEIAGSDFQRRATEQVTSFGATLRMERVTAVREDGGFVVETEAGQTVRSDYLILTEGRKPTLAPTLGLEQSADGGIAVDREFRSSVDRVYVVGRSARPKRSQAIISAGAGATAAVDILSREAGKDVQDWDTPPDDSTA